MQLEENFFKDWKLLYAVGALVFDDAVVGFLIVFFRLQRKMLHWNLFFTSLPPVTLLVLIEVS